VQTAICLGQSVNVCLQAFLIFDAVASEQLVSRSDLFMHQTVLLPLPSMPTYSDLL